MYTLLLTSILACGNKEEDSGLIHISNDGPTVRLTQRFADQQMDLLFILPLVSNRETNARVR